MPLQTAQSPSVAQPSVLKAEHFSLLTLAVHQNHLCSFSLSDTGVCFTPDLQNWISRGWGLSYFFCLFHYIQELNSLKFF